MRRVFADTSYFIALIAPNDALHQRATSLSSQPLALTTTGFVMTELTAFLSEPPNRELFNSLLQTIRSNRAFQFVACDPELFDAGAERYAQRLDKSWSLVDCISFIVMEREKLHDALTGDRHFQQAGFKALLLEEDSPPP